MAGCSHIPDAGELGARCTAPTEVLARCGGGFRRDAETNPRDAGATVGWVGQWSVRGAWLVRLICATVFSNRPDRG
jgi:hypothetical protein